ncbi:hypothetical protein Tsubulata_040416 [Turnera subulata]|uniref:C2 NT-type domain-containing protein n=1 Tax=Turnera subulata TaxID=218843 RepID=A0A9Q0JC14_9ROSI|nr:hypothetical protein Tsubulata_040416 [Turnera subulata]
MKYWLKRLPGSATTKKVHVKVKPLKLEGLEMERGGDGQSRERMIVIKMKWKGPRSGFVSLIHHRASKCQSNYSIQKFLKKGEAAVEWDEEFEGVCDFSVSSKDKYSFDPWDISFNVLYGEDTKSRTKMAVLGKIPWNIAELASGLESDVERRLPISLKMDGVSIQATLSVSVSFAEVRDPQDPTGMVQSSAQEEDNNSNNKEGSIKRVKGLTAFKNKSRPAKADHLCSSDSDVSSVLDSDGLPVAKSTRLSDMSSAGADLGSSPSSKTRSDSGLKRNVSSSWKKRRLSFGFSNRKKTTDDDPGTNVVDSVKCGSVQESESCITKDWELKEVMSRDGEARLKANVFFASFDQRDEKAAGESACAAIVAVIADWLHSNQGLMPTLKEFDSLITQGSSDWRKLCDNEAYTNSFPDNHFDLETVLNAGLSPLSILHEKSFTGVFSPEKFENLKGAMSFDEIWAQISRNTADYDRIYIVSWNDHFFVLKAEADAYYIIDSLGERLFEGCNQAYILKFDDSTLMYGKAVKDDVNTEEMTEAERSNKAEEKSDEEIICKGKECCREFIKRFFAAVPLGQLEEEEKKGTVSTFSLLRRLQIDFHYCSSLSASTSTSLFTSSASSPALSSEGCIFS